MQSSPATPSFGTPAATTQAQPHLGVPVATTASAHGTRTQAREPHAEPDPARQVVNYLISNIGLRIRVPQMVDQGLPDITREAPNTFKRGPHFPYAMIETMSRRYRMDEFEDTQKNRGEWADLPLFRTTFEARNTVKRIVTPELMSTFTDSTFMNMSYEGIGMTEAQREAEQKGRPHVVREGFPPIRSQQPMQNPNSVGRDPWSEAEDPWITGSQQNSTSSGRPVRDID